MRGRVPPPIVFAAALLGFVAAASSCALVRSVFPGSGPPPRPFNHAAHLGRGLDCISCHETTERDDAAGMPSRDLCISCHDDIDKDPKRPLEQKVAWFYDETGTPVWSTATKQSAEIRFSHRIHAAKKIACGACHDIEKSEGIAGTMVQRMTTCTACHERTAPGKNDCATCHRELDRDVAPPSHAALWKSRHGGCAREGRDAATANDCAMCHQKNECVACHQTEAPADHGSFWRLRGHGAAATVDRSRCETCHASDSCNRCHQESAPTSHGAGWKGPQNRHCTSCHVPLGASGSCFVCHRSTPGHDLAPPKPSWHSSVMVCRSCHAGSLTHPDNGDDCNACHK